MSASPPRDRAPPSRTESLVDGEFVLTGEDFRKIASIIHAHAGIALAESKAALVYSRLARRLRALGMESFKDYCALVGGLFQRAGALFHSPDLAFGASRGAEPGREDPSH